MEHPAQEAAEERLNSALTTIRDEFVSAHEDLTRQLEQANQRLNSLLGILSSSTQPGDPAGSGIELEKLRHAVAERDLALAASTKHAAELEAAVAELKAEIAQLRSRESWIVAANQDLSERLVVLRAEEKTNAKILSKANEEAERSAKLIAEREQAFESLNKQADLARKTLDEARQTSKRLTREVAALRRENVRLRDTLAAADSTASARDRQQRILLEALIANGHARKLGEILVSAGIITEDQLAEALGEQESGGQRMVGEILINNGHVEEEDVAQTIACQLHLPIIQLCEQTVQEEAVRTVDDILCTSHKCIPIRVTADRIFVAMANPRDEHAVEAIQKASMRRVVTIVATPSDVQAAIRRVFCL
ncbi:MAG: hypothetical protein NTZ09_12510 [Candidatus Hydrogenedentes bacterium]|nr:hypothetical protein [Candidatus Hydrogenedentota bacterium]